MLLYTVFHFPLLFSTALRGGGGYPLVPSAPRRGFPPGSGAGVPMSGPSGDIPLTR